MIRVAILGATGYTALELIKERVCLVPAIRTPAVGERVLLFRTCQDV